MFEPHGFIEQMHAAGAFAWLALAMAFVSTTLGLVGLMLTFTKSSGARTVGAFALAGVGLILAIGVAGRALGRMRTDQALLAVAPADQVEIRAQGYLESSYNVQLALEFAALPALLGICAISLARRRPAES